MKISIHLALAASASLSITYAVLPPGYEDQIWCPPGDCQIYTNPFGLVGAQSSFDLCYNTDTGNITDGVWTGSSTDVTPPEGWAEPDNCTAEEYSECDVDDDCVATVRTMTPIDGWGELCVCFANSSYYPFDQCEGQDASNCLKAKCSGDPCEGYEAICVSGFDGAGACTISRDASRSGDDDDYDDDDWERTKKPTRKPSRRPTRKPSRRPTRKPSRRPTRKPSPGPTFETPSPTDEPVTPAPVPDSTPAPVPSGPVTPIPVHISMPMVSVNACNILTLCCQQLIVASLCYIVGGHSIEG